MDKVDIENWNRKEHFEFFSAFEDPSFGISSEVLCTKAYHLCKETGDSFFAYYLHRSLQAVNETNEFKYRISDDEVVICDTIHAGPTIARKDGSFGFSFIPYTADFNIFKAELQKEIDNVESCSGLRKSIDAERINVIYYSTLPWIRFTGLKHPFSSKETAGIPKITFGKVFQQGSNMIMPIAIQAHHGLVDGLHISRYLEKFETLLNQ
jgi:chloramphenicol O-acetyltransferase type A